MAVEDDLKRLRIPFQSRGLYRPKHPILAVASPAEDKVPASQDFWDDLLGHLKDRALLPVIGPELVTVLDGERRVALSQLLGERLAERYQLTIGSNAPFGLDDA